jgi:uncharacterized protein
MPRHVAILLIFFLASPVLADSAPPTEDSLRQLLTVTNTHKLLDDIVGQMDERMKSFTQQAVQGLTVSAEQQKIIDSMQNRTVALLKQEMSWEKLEPIYLRIYRESFTQEDVDGMLDFYRTPAGRSLLLKMPVVMQKSMTETQQMLLPLVQEMRKIQEGALAELKSPQAQSRGTYVEEARTKKSIQAAFDRAKNDIYRVYAEALRRNPDLLGKTIYRITVGAEGHVVEITVKESSLKDAQVSGAISDIIAKMDFGKVHRAGNVTFMYPLEFLPH